MKLIICYLFFLLMFSCKNEESNMKNSKSGDTLTKIISNENDTGHYSLTFSFYKNGEIKEIRRNDLNGKLLGEEIRFYPNGRLEEKISFKNDSIRGNGYFFYMSTGTLSAQKYFRNNKPVFHAATYWEDSVAVIKTLFDFNDSGISYHKVNFDRNGNITSEEGKKR